MRSRFAAFALKKPDYLWRTLHATHEDRSRPEAEVIVELRNACASKRFMGLQILDRAAPDADGVARVLFSARVFQSGRDQSFVEASDFLHDGTGWRYVGGSAQRVADLEVEPRELTLESFAAALRL